MALPFIGPASLNPQQGGGGGITSVKLSPAAIRFPTARRPAPQRRPLEPTTKEKFAPLAPFLVGGIMDMFQGKPETLILHFSSNKEILAKGKYIVMASKSVTKCFRVDGSLQIICLRTSEHLQINL